MNKKGFTLIEMLTVIVVLLLLMGLTVKLFPNINRATEKARTIVFLQKTAYAINEFYAAYGTYPPVSTVTFELEDTLATDAVYPESGPALDGETAPELSRKYGLLAFLIPCPIDKIDSEYFGKRNDDDLWYEDSTSDSLAKAKWSEFIEGIVHSYQSTNTAPVAGFDIGYITKGRTIIDGWGQGIRYVSKAPYTSYKLWSIGGDGTSGTADDIYVDQIE